jgi:pimeloyl-ACP methyl ester carboxylesterase
MKRSISDSSAIHQLAPGAEVEDHLSEPQESIITVERCRIRLLRGGRGGPLVFLHGGRGVEAWLPFFGELAAAFDVIVPEHPGFGRSDTPAWLDTLSDLSNFYLEFFKELGLTDINLVGTSLGGWLAADIAVRDRSRLSTLTLIAPAGLQANALPGRDLASQKPEQALRNAFYDQSIVDRLLAAEPDKNALQRQNKNLQTLSRLTKDGMDDPQLRKWLHRIATPTLIMWGDTDRILHPDSAQEYRSLVPNSQLVIVERCGHLPHVENAQGCAATILQFIHQASQSNKHSPNVAVKRSLASGSVSS